MDLFKSGVYRFLNKNTGKSYIGSTYNIYIRLKDHISMLNRNKHHSIKLQRAWNKYGEENFEFEVLEFVENESFLIMIEQHWIGELDSYKNGYNVNPTAGKTRLNAKLSEETKKKISNSKKGKKLSEETKEKMRIAYHAKFEEDPEYGKKRSIKLKGKKKSEEFKEARRAYKHKEESLLKMKKPKSQETKDRMRISRLGKKLSEETKEKIRLLRLKQGFLRKLESGDLDGLSFEEYVNSRRLERKQITIRKDRKLSYTEEEKQIRLKENTERERIRLQHKKMEERKESKIREERRKKMRGFK